MLLQPSYWRLHCSAVSELLQHLHLPACLLPT
jgi:hypothetical protein